MAGAVPIAPAPLRARSPSPTPPPAAPAPTPPPPPPRSPTSPRDTPDDVSPWLAAYTPIRVPASASADMRDMTFTYLYEQKVYRQKTGPLHALPSLRCLARACRPKVVQEGSKRDLVCRLMLRMSENVAASRATWDNAFEPHRSRYFSIVRHELGLRPMFYAPSHRQLLAGIPPGKERARQDRGSDRIRRPSQSADQQLSSSEKQPAAPTAPTPPPPAKEERVASRPPPPPPAPTPAVVPSTTVATQPTPAAPQPVSTTAHTEPPLTNSEFARLVNLLTTRTLRSAPRQPLHFWTARVEREFNSGRVVVPLDTSVTLIDPSIDASRAPVCHRAGATLRLCYFETCELFAAAFRLWSPSQAARSAFASYVNAAAGTTTLSDIGKRCCIMFIALRCGLPDMMTDLTSFAWERAPAPPLPRPPAPDPVAPAPPPSPPAPPPERAVKRRRVDAPPPPASPPANALNNERVHGIVAQIATSTVSAAVAAAFERARKRDDSHVANGRDERCSTALEKMPRATRDVVKQFVSSIAAATVSAGVSATMSLSVTRDENDVSALICKLKNMIDLKANIATDVSQPLYLKRYVESEINRLRSRIEASQSQALQ